MGSRNKLNTNARKHRQRFYSREIGYIDPLLGLAVQD